MASRQAQKARAREQLAVERAARARKKRQVRIMSFGAAGVAVVLLVVVIVWAVKSRGGDEGETSVLPQPMSSVGNTGRPPWPLPDDPVEGARAAGLDVAAMEGTAKHFHAHVEIVVDGKSVPVPGNIGVGNTGMSELHTHDAGGLIHIEAPTNDKRYILGQLFRTWQVRLDEKSIGGLKVGDGNTLRAYVDRKEVDGDPAAIELKPRQQIVLVYGPADENVKLPTYTFAPDA